MSAFFRFPHTPHLAWLGTSKPRDDKVLSTQERDELLSKTICLEEKVDGANLGFSLGPNNELRAQNRGQYLLATHAGQFARLPAWLAVHGEAICQALMEHSGRQLSLFGEWCAARHSQEYTRLPDWFLLFDVYEAATGRFWSNNRRDAFAVKLGLATTPQLAHGRFTLMELTAKLDLWPSHFRDGPLEGVVVRSESAMWCELRAKLLRADFAQTIGEHWRQRPLVWNRLVTTTTA